MAANARLRCIALASTRWAAGMPVECATRRAPWAAAQGRRHYRLMRDHMSAVPPSLLAHLVQMPEVAEARKYFQEGKRDIAVQHLARADEISTASGMAELSLLTSEALAYVHALSGDFSTEANYRANCAQASRVLQEVSPGVATDLTLFDSLHNWALTDIKCGLLNTETLIDAREVARRVGKGGKGLERTCDMTEVLAAVDGSHSTVSFEEAPMLATALTEAVSDGCGGEAALSGSAYLVLGSALHRLGQRAANAPANMGTSMDAKEALHKGLELVDGPCIEAEALVKVGGLLFLSRIHLENREFEEADKAASDALGVAEKAVLPHAVDEAVCQLGVVRKGMGDFVVAEGLFRTCTAKLTQGPKARCPTTWEMMLLDRATEEHSQMLEAMSFNSHSRKPEADQIREKYALVQEAFPVTASAAKRLRQGALEHWYVRAFSPNLPTILQETD